LISEIDYRDNQTQVRNQGDRSTCVGFAVAAENEWMRPSTIRSVEDALWAAHQLGANPSHERTSVQLALEGLRLHRHAEESAWPYGSPPFPAARPAVANETGRQSDMVVWRRMTTIDADEVTNEISRGYAVVLTLGVVVGSWSQSGMIDAPAGQKTPGNHAVLVVGSTSSGNGSNSVIIKNSWGTAWGTNGYGYVSERYLNNYVRAGHVLEPAA
jgi:C1A family cysteine protease